MQVIVVVVLLLLTACGGGSSPTGASNAPVAVATPAPPPRVVIMSVDGFRPDVLPVSNTPHIDGLAALGSFTWQAQTINPSNTLPSHTSMLTGVLPAVHKITWDDYLPARGSLTVPSLFSALKEAGKRSAAVVGKDKFKTVQDAGSIDAFVLCARGDDDVANQAILQIDAGFELVFVHFPDVDLTGHDKKWMSTQYIQKVETVDAAIGRILAAVPPNMTVILTADHGGSDYGHGTAAALHMTIPWVIRGPRIKVGNALAAVKVTTVDTAVTAAYILGVKISDTVTGRVVSEAFLQ